MKILVGIDGSTESLRALANAARLAASLHAGVRIVYVGEPLHIPEEREALRAELEGARRREGEALLAKAAATLSGVAVELRYVESGAAPVMLAELAGEGDVDFVVVGSRGKGAIARALLGSTSDRLAHLCAKPVLVVR